MKKLNNILIIIGPLCFIIFWEIFRLAGFFNEIFTPSSLKIVTGLINLFRSNLLSDVFQTLIRTVLSFVLGGIVGIIIGLILGSSQKVYIASEFLVDFFRSLPATALFPLFLLLFGIGNTSKIAVAAFSCMLVVLINTMYGVRNTDPTRVIVSKMEGASTYQIYSKVIFPATLPETFAGLRIGLSLSLIIVVVSEMFVGTSLGLGQLINNSHLTFEIPEMYAAILITGLLGYFLNKLFILFEKKLIHWSGK